MQADKLILIIPYNDSLIEGNLNGIYYLVFVIVSILYKLLLSFRISSGVYTGCVFSFVDKIINFEYLALDDIPFSICESKSSLSFMPRS